MIIYCDGSTFEITKPADIKKYGENVPTGMDIAKWLIEYDLDHDILPMDFSWYVHSQNVNGRDNINGLLANYSKVTGKFVCTSENIRYIINNT